jgi:REP element-mobilizing transposase RayT
MGDMARRPRQELAGGVHHVFARGNNKQDIYICDRDREVYLATLGEVVIKKGWSCLAYCLMDNHVHLLIRTPEANLGAGMGRLHTLYAQGFNKRYRRCGHVFQGRFGSVLIRTDEQLLVAARYIALNPVEAGLCVQPGEWAWSSHAAVMGAAAPAWLDVQQLLVAFGMWGGDARRGYAHFVELR